MSKELSPEEIRNIVVEHMTLQWLKQNGLDPSDPKTPAIEIDENEETSQLVAWKLTAEEAYDYFLEAFDKIESMGYQGKEQAEPEADDLLRDYVEDNLGNGAKKPSFMGHPIPEHPTPTDAVTTSNTTFVFMETPPGTPTYVRDVRSWLAEVDRLQLADDVEVEGQLYLSYDTPFIMGERTECLYCGDKTDIHLTIHDCTGGDEDQ